MIDYIIKKLEVPKSIVKVTIDDKKLMIPHRTINKGSKVLRHRPGNNVQNQLREEQNLKRQKIMTKVMTENNDRS